MTQKNNTKETTYLNYQWTARHRARVQYIDARAEMENGKVQHHMVGHGEMAWVGESTIRRDGHRMFVEITVYTVSKMSDVSDEVSLESRILLRSRVFAWVWRASALWSCGWIGGGVKDKGRLSQLLCVGLTVFCCVWLYIGSYLNCLWNSIIDVCLWKSQRYTPTKQIQRIRFPKE